MRAALTFIACMLGASCATSGGTSPLPGQPAASAPPQAPQEPEPDAEPEPKAEPAEAWAQPAQNAPTIAELQCLSEPLPQRLRVSFDPGHTARDLAIWYATTTCRSIESSRDLLARSTLTQIDALANRDELKGLFGSLLRGLGLVVLDRGDGGLAIVAGPGQGGDANPARGDRILLAPAAEENSDAR